MRRLPLLLAMSWILSPIPPSRAADGPSYTRAEDVIYGRKFGTALTMDVFRPGHDANGLGVVFVVSGGWISAHEAIAERLIAPVVDRGYTVFAVVHGSQPKFTIPEIVQDMNRAVRFIRYHAQDYGIDPGRIGIYGGSAGGHLSLMQGTGGDDGDPKAKDPVDRVSSRVQAVACFYPPTDFLNYGKPGEVALGTGILENYPAPFDFHGMDPKRKKFVPVEDPSERLEIGRRISPIRHVTPDDPPTLIIHGDADKLVPIQQAEAIVEQFKGAGVEAKLVVKPGAAHGWPDVPRDVGQFADWFDEHLKAAIAAPEARNHLEEHRTVEMTVRASKDGTHRKEYYLDSVEDYGREDNCTVVIAYDHAGKFKQAGIDDPAAYYKGKTIRVTGTIIREADQTRIRVSEPGQIRIVGSGR
jgi:acetyl esterase/lipase